MTDRIAYARNARETIHAYIQKYPGKLGEDIAYSHIRINKDMVYRTLRHLGVAGLVRKEGNRQAARFYAVELQEADRDAKGRGADFNGAKNPMWKGGPPPRPGKARGERNHTAKLRDADIPVIRERLLAGEQVAAIARTYGVAWPQIDRIKQGKGWTHV